MTISSGPADGLAAPPDDEPLEASQETAAAPAAQQPAPRRHRLLFWSAVLAALATVAGGGYLAATAYAAQTAPEQVVRYYLDAVAGGDAAGALAFGVVPAGEQQMLTDEVLGAQLEIAPMSDITVTVDVDSETTATARISYQLGFAAGPVAVDDSITLTKIERRWQLDAVAVPVTIDIANGRNRATLAGADLPDGPHLAFPGALPVVFDTPNMALSADDRVVRFGEPADDRQLAELSAAGRAAVGAAIDAALTACLAGTAEVQTLCPRPTDPRAVPGSLRGTAVKPASQVAEPSLLSDDGMVRIQTQLTVTGEYDQLDFNNQRVRQSGEQTVNVFASCNVTAPSLIVWTSA